MASRWTLIAGGVAVVAVILVVIYFKFWKKKSPEAEVVGDDSPDTRPMHNAPQPPSRTPTKPDKLLAALVNNLNADMRSVEIGTWFLKRLAAQAMTKDVIKCTDQNTFDYFAIANAIPGANDVTKQMTVKGLRALVDTVLQKYCDGDTTTIAPDQFINEMESYARSAFGPDGVLLGMNGYSMKSRLPLPS